MRRENSSSDLSEEEENGDNDFGAAAALSVPLAAFRFVTRLASGIFSRGQRNLDPVDLQSQSDSGLPSEGITKVSEAEVSDGSSSQKSVPIDGDNSENRNGKIEEVVPPKAAETLCGLRTEDAPASCEDYSYSFKRFDITRDPLDHYFIGANGQVLVHFISNMLID